ncbi:MAG: FAD-dependent oxidoreductase, partial [Solirubrobacteraceae bacterium]|nr:FAD-dependent oxidoreductase [Solirubrobacteraceae bacterium]
DWLLGNGIPLDLAADAGELSILGLDEGESYRGGGDRLLRGGAAQLLDGVAPGLNVRLEAAVTRVERTSQGVTVTLAGGERLVADGCVLTAPLGVLKDDGIAFSPPLPSGMRRAVDRLGVGLLNKLVLRYPEASWEPGTQLGVIGSSIGRTIGVFDLQAVTGEPIVAAFTGAGYARALERRSDADVVAAVTGQLARGFGDAARKPEGVQVTRWAADPWARGSYSFLPPGASSRDREALARPAGRLVLAGEHTSVDRPATMDGALLAGRRGAQSLLGVLAP